jgi:hypothetical protein
MPTNGRWDLVRRLKVKEHEVQCIKPYPANVENMVSA